MQPLRRLPVSKVVVVVESWVHEVNMNLTIPEFITDTEVLS